MTDETQDFSFAEYVQTMRERRRYSKSELARRADIDATYLGRIERGLLPPPRPKNLSRLAAALGLSQEERALLIELSGRGDTTPLPLEERTVALPLAVLGRVESQGGHDGGGHDAGGHGGAGPYIDTGSDAHAVRPELVAAAGTWRHGEDEAGSRGHGQEVDDDGQVAMILEGMARLQQQVDRLLAERESRIAEGFGPGLREEEVLASVEAILSARTPVDSGVATEVSSHDAGFRARGQAYEELRELRGQAQVLDTIVEMISSVPVLQTPHSREILLATHWIDDMFDAVPNLHRELWTSLETALHRGWDVVHVMALNGNDGQSTEWVRDMIGLLGTSGYYRPRYFARDTAPPLAYSFALVPDVAALQLITRPGRRPVSSALLYPGYPATGSALGELFTELHEQSQPLLHTHRGRPDSGSPASQIESEVATETRFAALLAAEEQEGERLSIWPNLSTPTIPPHCVDRQTCRRYGVEDVSELPLAMRNTLARMRRRHALFGQRARSTRYRSICKRQVVEQFLRDGRYAVDHPLLESATREERIDHLQVLLSLLRDTRYELALADSPPQHLFHTGLEIMATEQGGSAFLLGWRLSGARHDTVVDSEITEPGVVRDFRLYFENAWSQLPPHCTDKAQVISWLEDQLKRLLSV